MNDDERTQESPLAPHRPLSGPPGSQAANASNRQSGQAQQTTMAIPVVTDAAPTGSAPRPQVRSGRPAPPAGASAAPAPMAAPAPVQAAPEPAAPDVGAYEPATPTPADSDWAAPDRATAAPVPAPALAHPRSASSVRAAGTARKARLQLTRIDPWSVMKLAFALSIAMAIVSVVAVALVWSVLDAAGVWDSINSSVGTVLSEDDTTAFDITDYVGTSRVLGLTTIVAAANVVLLTAIATLAAFLYNLAASLLGGLEVTLAEDRN